VDHFWVSKRRSSYHSLQSGTTSQFVGAMSFLSCFTLIQADKGDQTGFDIILEKHLNGKFVMKDMMEFFRDR